MALGSTKKELDDEKNNNDKGGKKSPAGGPAPVPDWLKEDAVDINLEDDSSPTAG